MKDGTFEIKENIQLAPSVYRMVLKGDTALISSPGQFVNIRLQGMFLRRPISVCDLQGDRLTIIYKVVGKGTEKMSLMHEGMKLQLLTGLGNGYDLSVLREDQKKILLIAGGVGVPPMFLLAKELIRLGKEVTAVLGFNKKSEIFYYEEFKELGVNSILATADGSCGIKGFVTDALPEDYDYFYCCGPEPMLRAVYKNTKSDGQFSFEERMGCGFGVCMGCSCKTITGYKRICKDGPVLRKEEILWD